MLSFPYVDSELGYWYIIWKVNTRKRGMNLKSILCTMSLWVGISSKACLFVICTVVMRTLMHDYRAILGLPNHWSNSCRRCNLKYVYCCVNGDLGSWCLSWRKVNGLGVRGNYVCSLVMSVIYMELGGRKR